MEVILPLIGFLFLGATILYVAVNNILLIDKEYDKFLNDLMDKDTPIEYRDSYMIKLKGTESYIWTSNYPYSFGHTYPIPGGYPTMKTRKRLARYILTH